MRYSVELSTKIIHWKSLFVNLTNTIIRVVDLKKHIICRKCSIGYTFSKSGILRKFSKKM